MIYETFSLHKSLFKSTRKNKKGKLFFGNSRRIAKSLGPSISIHFEQYSFLGVCKSLVGVCLMEWSLNQQTILMLDKQQK